jgi:hypothetical protein
VIIQFLTCKQFPQELSNSTLLWQVYVPVPPDSAWQTALASEHCTAFGAIAGFVQISPTACS